MTAPKKQVLSDDQKKLLAINRQLIYCVLIKNIQLLTAPGHYLKRLPLCSRPLCVDFCFGKAHCRP